nr:YkvA family protein [Lacrimispora amygdalina]
MIVIIAGLLYLVSPIDLMPDAIPVVGLLDDGLVLLYVLRTAHNDLMSYEEWREENESFSTEE